jgi:hypothetical protein
MKTTHAFHEKEIAASADLIYRCLAAPFQRMSRMLSGSSATPMRAATGD